MAKILASGGLPLYFDDDILKATSPYRIDHVNRFGKYPDQRQYKLPGNDS